MEGTLVLIGTRKGAFLLHGDNWRREWRLQGPHFLGSIVNHLVLDPRDDKTLLMAAKTGHLGPTVFRSKDWGKSWKEAQRPPAFPKSKPGEKGKAVDAVFWISPGHRSEPKVWYAGTTPHGLFRSEDGGKSWSLVEGFEKHLRECQKKEGRLGGTPDGEITHSILVDPRNRKQLFVGLSTGGFFESADRGKTWKALNRGVAADFLPEKDPDFGHDPHIVLQHPLRPSRFYQQNHCGIYRLDRPASKWVRIGNQMPKEIGDIGFGIVSHPRDPDTVWVFPMDGTTVWPRTSPGGKPAAYCSRDAGKSWERQDFGFPSEQAWFTVKRQAFASDQDNPVGLYLGTTSGEIWASADEGRSWQQIAAHLPHVYSVAAITFAR